MSPRDSHCESKPSAHPRWTLVACILASSLSFVDGSVLNVALPAIKSSYGAGAQDVQWVVNAYLLPLSALLLLGGAVVWVADQQLRAGLASDPQLLSKFLIKGGTLVHAIDFNPEAVLAAGAELADHC